MRNTSDMIEKYLKELLSQATEIEIRRSEIAANFGVVPSQINYVIKTRFTLPKGFEVESKRGGGGYIRIVRIQYSDEHDFLMALIPKIPEKLSVSSPRRDRRPPRPPRAPDPGRLPRHRHHRLRRGRPPRLRELGVRERRA